MAWVPAPPAEPPVVGLVAALGPPGGAYLDPPERWDSPALPPFNPDRPQPPVPADPPLTAVAGPSGPQRWETGFSYQPELVCDGGGVTDPCTTDMDPPDSTPANVSSTPFLVWTGDKCSSFGWQAHDFVGRAVRSLLAVESKLIAGELWTGAQAQASGWDNAYLASPASDVLTSGQANATTALDCLEQYIASCGSGARGAIHCTPQLGSIWSGLGNTLRSAGGLILTYRGTVIIPDAGYDGSGPDGQPATDGSQWAYATLMPQVRRGDVVVNPDSYEEALDRSLNTVTWRAWRAAAATFPACCLGAANVNVPLCLIGGVS